MNTNEKPRALGTGQIHYLDDESITANGIVINHSSATSQSIDKSSPINTNDYTSKELSTDEMLELVKMLRDQRKRRDDAALRLPPMRCGCRDPLRCACYTKRGAR